MDDNIVRRSSRTNKGVPPPRYTPSDFMRNPAPTEQQQHRPVRATVPDMTNPFAERLNFIKLQNIAMGGRRSPSSEPTDERKARTDALKKKMILEKEKIELRLRQIELEEQLLDEEPEVDAD